jgi:hypothetical protein
MLSATAIGAAALQDTLTAYGTVSAPGAGASIAAFDNGTFAKLPAGTYDISGMVSNPGTAETTATGLANFQIIVGAVTLARLPAIAAGVPFRFKRVTVSGTSSVKIATNVAATAGSIYIGHIAATLLA